LATIFEKFWRGREAVDRRIPGLGLGLHLSYRIVQAHGGELTVTSAPGEGSVFGFALPAAEPARIPAIERVRDQAP
jgi:signal transduction histidine kinase